jgi:WD40 repeat protein
MLAGETKRIRTMVHPSKGDFVSVCFSGDSKYLITVSTDRTIVVWSWEKEKIVTSSTVVGDCTRVSCPPLSTTSNLQITTSGPGHLRVWTFNPADSMMKPNALVPQSKESETFADHTWLTTMSNNVQRLAVVTEGSDNIGSRGASVLIFQSSTESPYIEGPKRTIGVMLQGKDTKIETIAAYSKGTDTINYTKQASKQTDERIQSVLLLFHFSFHEF